jgi:hypothetical protein
MRKRPRSSAPPRSSRPMSGAPTATGPVRGPCRPRPGNWICAPRSCARERSFAQPGKERVMAQFDEVARH